MDFALLAGKNPLFGANNRGIYIFGFEIYYYALCIVSGIILATVLSALLMKRRNMSSDFIFTLFIFCIPVALICTRLFYCITDGMPISKWFSWSSIREGGLSVIGGVIGGVGTGYIVCRVKKVNFFRAADCVVITILIAQVFGRWGNFFNGEVYGGVVKNPSLQWFPFAVPIDSSGSGIGPFSNPNATWHYAFFFYEGCLNALGFALLFTAAWRWTKKPNGLFTFAYFVWYGTVRSVMEPLRDSSYILNGGGVPWSLVFSILMVVFGAAGIAVLLWLNYRKEGAVFGSKTGDPCGITEYLTPYKDEVPYYSKINILGANYPPKPEEEEIEKEPFSAKASRMFKKLKAVFSGKTDEEISSEERADGAEESPEETADERAERSDCAGGQADGKKEDDRRETEADVQPSDVKKGE